MKNLSKIILKILVTVLLILLVVGVVAIGFTMSATLILKYFIFGVFLMYLGGFTSTLTVYVWKGKGAWIIFLKEIGKAPN